MRMNNYDTDFDIVLTGGKVIDGSGSEPFFADIGMTGKVIKAIGNLKDYSAKRQIDCSGLTVTPGFIDAHCHTDIAYSLVDNAVPGKVMQGITTDICGACGMSVAPVSSALAKQFLLQNGGALETVNIPFSLTDYFNLIEETGNSTNVALFTGHSNLRVDAVGMACDTVSQAGLRKMKKILHGAVSDGALGLSTGLTYVPSKFAPTEELIELCRKLSPDCIYNSHMRNEGDRLVESVEEVIRIAKSGGVYGHISHLKAEGSKNHGKVKECLEMITKANDNNIRITFDVYPYTAASINLSALFPGSFLSRFFTEGSDISIDQKSRAGLLAQMENQDGEKTIPPSGFDNIVISRAHHNEHFEGQTVAAIAEKLKLPPLEVLLKILIESQAKSTVIYHSVSEADLITLMKSPFCTIGTDAYARDYTGPTADGTPHPRNYGAFPRFIRRYVLDKQIMTLPAAIRKITGFPAEIFGLQNKGLLKTGYDADITVFDENTIRETGNYTTPSVKPEGICYVLVNGRLTVDDSIFRPVKAGRPIRRKSA
jgi:N-acyl-D-amino-acid deacylase